MKRYDNLTITKRVDKSATLFARLEKAMVKIMMNSRSNGKREAVLRITDLSAAWGRWTIRRGLWN